MISFRLCYLIILHPLSLISGDIGHIQAVVTHDELHQTAAWAYDEAAALTTPPRPVL